MFKWLSGLFKPAPDQTEVRLLNIFGFLLRDFDFSFAREKLGDAVDKNGKFFFYGPLIAYQFYNDKICINILHLVQRDDYDVYITEKQSDDQMYIKNGIALPSYLAYDLPLLAKEMKESILNSGELYGHQI